MPKSKIFLSLLISFIVGIGLASFFRLAFWIIYGIILTGLAFIIVGWPKIKIRILGFCLLAIILGILRYELSQSKNNPDQIQFYNGQKISLTGLVAREPDLRNDQSKLTVEAKTIKDKNGQEKKVKGKILVTTYLYPQYQYGDILAISGAIEKPVRINDFAYDRYLGKSNIYSVCYYPNIKLVDQNKGSPSFRLILTLKEKIQSLINSSLPEPQASLFSALILGNQRGLPQELLDKFSLTGVSHLVAISGLQITIVAGLLMNLGLALGLSRSKSFYWASFLLIIYIIIIAWPASAVRAGIMGIMVLLALKAGRLNRSANAMTLAGVGILLANPRALRDDIGFQLSFVSVFGLIYLNPLFTKWFQKVPSFFQLRSSLAMTMAAQTMTLPLIILYWHRFSVVAPIANIFILPPQALIMITGFLALFLGFIFQPLAQVVFWLIWLLVSYLILVVEILARFNFASLPTAKLSWVGLSIFVITIISFLIKSKKYANSS